jgi:hypothetical protein
MFNEYDIVILKKDIPEQKLSIGMRGTILLVFDEKSLPRAYEVEFFDENGRSLAVITVKEDLLKKCCVT